MSAPLNAAILLCGAVHILAGTRKNYPAIYIFKPLTIPPS